MRVIERLSNNCSNVKSHFLQISREFIRLNVSLVNWATRLLPFFLPFSSGEINGVLRHFCLTLASQVEVWKLTKEGFQGVRSFSCHPTQRSQEPFKDFRWPSLRQSIVPAAIKF